MFEIKYKMDMGISLTEQGIHYDNRQLVFNMNYLFNSFVSLINMFRKNKLHLIPQFIEVGDYHIGLDYDHTQILKAITLAEAKKMEDINNQNNGGKR